MNLERERGLDNVWVVLWGFFSFFFIDFILLNRYMYMIYIYIYYIYIHIFIYIYTYICIYIYKHMHIYIYIHIIKYTKY